MTTGFIYDDAFLKHDAGAGHPECRERLQATISHLQSLPWFASLIQLTAEPADKSWLTTIHTGSYILRAEQACKQNLLYLDSNDVGICPASFDIALLAAGAPVALANEIIQGTVDNGFSLLRPPGHHAENNQAMGFCLFNNVAILARYLQHQHGIDKILILDWDVHHGNGTQHSFEDDASVLYISTHEYPFYPGTGAYSETGRGSGVGATLNCPMPAGATDQDYENIFNEKIVPKINFFKPEFIIISAGFDAHVDDPLGHICLTTEFYGWMTQVLMEMADKHCQGHIVSVLEGGYDLQALPGSIAKHLGVLSGNR